MTAKIFRSSLLLLLLAWANTVYTQQDQQSLNYGFVSPNTSENLKLEQAIEGMNSQEEMQLRSKAINLSCVVRARIQAFRALGAWSDGAEYTIMLRLKSDEATLRYLVSRMGRDAQQKYVIYFHPQLGGTSDLYILRPRMPSRDLVALSSALERAGIPFRTFVPLHGTTSIYIIDLSRDLHLQVLTAARSLRARVSHQSGKALLFGDDERQRAKAVFEQEIRTYESKHPNLPPTCNAQKVKKR